jgi:hypothetical protein
VIEATGERFYEAELRRLRGELLLLQAGAGRPSPAESAAARPPGPDPSGRAEAEACFRRALTIARGVTVRPNHPRRRRSLANGPKGMRAVVGEHTGRMLNQYRSRLFRCFRELSGGYRRNTRCAKCLG